MSIIVCVVCTKTAVDPLMTHRGHACFDCVAPVAPEIPLPPMEVRGYDRKLDGPAGDTPNATTSALYRHPVTADVVSIQLNLTLSSAELYRDALALAAAHAQGEQRVAIHRELSRLTALTTQVLGLV